MVPAQQAEITQLDAFLNTHQMAAPMVMGCHLMDGQVIKHNHIIGLQHRPQHLVEVSGEDHCLHGPIDIEQRA